MTGVQTCALPICTVIRTAAMEVRETSRDTLGVRLVNLGDSVSVVSIAQVKDVPSLDEERTTVASEGEDSALEK